MKVFVFGATGLTGRRLCARLILDEHMVFAGVRGGASRKKDIPPSVHCVNADLSSDITGVLTGMDIAVFAAGSGSKTGPDQTLSIDRDGAIGAIDEAVRAKVSRFVMLSSMGVDTPDEMPAGLRHYMRAKAHADEYLRKSGLNHTIVRPARLTLDPFAGSISDSPNSVVFEPISRDDVVEAMICLLKDRRAANRTIDLMGGNMQIRTALTRLLAKREEVRC